MASTSPLEAIVDRMMERLKKENPNVEFYKKPKKEKVSRKRMKTTTIPKKLH